MSKRGRNNTTEVPESKATTADVTDAAASAAEQAPPPLVVAAASSTQPASSPSVAAATGAPAEQAPSPFVVAAAEVAASSPATAAAVAVSAPPSPASNRERFRNFSMPLQLSCDLSTISAEPGFRFSFQAVVLVVFPASSNPLRRHVLVGDGRGTVGITVWNAHVNAFSFESVGKLVVITKVSMTTHNGVRGISLNKESSLSFSSDHDHFALQWWNSIPRQRAVPAIMFNETKDQAVVNICGIVGSVTVEQKNVRSDARELLTLKLVDRTGVMTIRSWNHGTGMFQHLVDTPVLIQRVRVTSFAGLKIGELFDGSGSIVSDGNFEGAADLKAFWSE